MKTLYINVNNENIQSSNELIVLAHRLDIHILFYLGEKIAKGCKVEDEISLITEFNSPENEEEYKRIAEQIEELKIILFGDECKGCFEFKLPKKYINWLNYHPNFNPIYNKNFSNDRNSVILINLEELYEDSVAILQCKILSTLEHNDINEIVFNDKTIKSNSSIVVAVNKILKNTIFMTFVQFEERKRLIIEEKERLIRIEKEKLENEKREKEIKQIEKKQQERKLKEEQKKNWLENPVIQSEEEFFFFQLVSKKVTCNLKSEQILKGIRLFLDKTNKNIIIPNGISDPCSPFFKGEYTIEVTNRDKGFLRLFLKLCELSKGINDELMKEIYDNLYKIEIRDGINTVKIPSIGGFNGRTKSYLDTQWYIKELKDKSLEIRRIS